MYIVENGENWAVLVVTPLMKRVQEIQPASEIIFIDSTSSVESTQSTTTLLLAATKAGAIPIGILMHKNQTTEAYTKAFDLLKTSYPKCLGDKDVSICGHLIFRHISN